MVKKSKKDSTTANSIEIIIEDLETARVKKLVKEVVEIPLLPIFGFLIGLIGISPETGIFLEKLLGLNGAAGSIQFGLMFFGVGCLCIFAFSDNKFKFK